MPGSLVGFDVGAHFAEEEELFDRLRSTLDHGELVGLAERARRAKDCAPAFPPA